MRVKAWSWGRWVVGVVVTALVVAVAGSAAAAPAEATATATATATAPTAAAKAKRTVPKLGLPAPRGCLPGRRLTFRVRAPRRASALRLVRVLVNGRPVRTLRGRAMRKTITLRDLRTARRLRVGRTRVTVLAITRRGGALTATRTYRLCSGQRAELERGARGSAPSRSPAAPGRGGAAPAPAPAPAPAAGGPAPGGAAAGDGPGSPAAPAPGGAAAGDAPGTGSPAGGSAGSGGSTGGGGSTAGGAPAPETPDTPAAPADGFGPSTTGPRRALPGCADDTTFPGGVHPGGEWPINGRDYDNTRTQGSETTFGAAEAGRLGELWRFSTTAGGGGGDVTGTPVVVDGCVYAVTSTGSVFAINAETGAKVWNAELPDEARSFQSVSVRYGKVFVGATGPTPTAACEDCAAQPFFVAYDQATGRMTWRTQGLEDAQGADILGAPLVFDASDNGRSDPVVFTGISAFGAEADFGDGSIRYANDGSFVLMDATTGEVLRQTYVVKKDPGDEHAGCGIWSSPAIDFASRRGYVGVSNPHNPESEHPNCNSVIEFVADRTDPEFGTITRNFKGTPDDYVRDFVPEYPCIAIPGIPRPTPSQEVSTCTDMDLAIGAPPNLVTLPDGRRMVGVGQKSGHYHLWDLATGEREWRSVLGIPTIIGGIVGATAYDGEKVYGPSTVPGFVFAVGQEDGTPAWVGQHSPVSYGNPTTTANGVVYTTTQRNTLNAYDAASGRQLLEAPLPPGTNAAVAFQGTVGGVAVARNTVYTAVGNQSMPEGFIVAFRPGATGGGGGGGGGTPVPQPPAQAGSLIIAGPGATSTGFPPAVMPKGASLGFLNLDNAGHDVVAKDRGADGKPLFRSATAAIGGQTPVAGAEELEGGQYAFFCSIHPSMTGTLAVSP